MSQVDGLVAIRFSFFSFFNLLLYSSTRVNDSEAFVLAFLRGIQFYLCSFASSNKRKDGIIIQEKIIHNYPVQFNIIKDCLDNLWILSRPLRLRNMAKRIKTIANININTQLRSQNALMISPDRVLSGMTLCRFALRTQFATFPQLHGGTSFIIMFTASGGTPILPKVAVMPPPEFFFGR